MTVRRATIEDAKEIFAIEMECFSVPWSLDSIETELLNEDKKLYYVVEDANGVVGYAGAWLVYDDGMQFLALHHQIFCELAPDSI